jgi:imidazolonepropionase-like amidohydrolase
VPLLAAVALAVTGVTVIDGTGAAPLQNATVVVESGRIAAVGRSGEVAIPTGADVVDGHGRFLVPGFVDVHAHATYLEWSHDNAGRSQATYDRKISEETLRLLLAHGITTIRNPGGPTEEAVRLREDVASGRLVGPRIRTAGEPLNVAPYFDGLMRPVATVEEIRREVGKQARAGVDFIKLYAGLPAPLVRAAVAEAHAHGLRAIGHLQATSWTAAARAGIDGLCHGADWSEEELAPGRRDAYREAVAARGAMKARIEWLEAVDPEGPEIRTMVEAIVAHGVAVDPTLVACETKFKGDEKAYLESPDLALAPEPMRKSFAANSFVRDWTPEDFRRGHAVWPKMLALVKRYREGGVLLTAGSDEPNAWIVPGPGFHRELALLVEAGIPALEVLSIATRNGAKALGLTGETGTISPGKRADLVFLKADPSTSIANTRTIEWVMKDGVRYEPGKLLARQ